MRAAPFVCLNHYGGYYAHGKSFTHDRWEAIIQIYRDTVENEGICTVRKLASLARVSRKSAKKAIEFHKDKEIITKKRGTHCSGIGSKKGLSYEHHAYIYKIYSRKPERPRDNYVLKLNKKFGIDVSPMFITKWFQSIGPFKGNLRETSLFPPAKEGKKVQTLKKDYLSFISNVCHHKQIVFADEKPMKSQDIYRLVRRDPVTGIVRVMPIQKIDTIF
jgi:hypothetical protein